MVFEGGYLNPVSRLEQASAYLNHASSQLKTMCGIIYWHISGAHKFMAMC